MRATSNISLSTGTPSFRASSSSCLAFWGHTAIPSDPDCIRRCSARSSGWPESHPCLKYFPGWHLDQRHNSMPFSRACRLTAAPMRRRYGRLRGFRVEVTVIHIRAVCILSCNIRGKVRFTDYYHRRPHGRFTPPYINSLFHLGLLSPITVKTLQNDLRARIPFDKFIRTGADRIVGSICPEAYWANKWPGSPSRSAEGVQICPS